MNGTLVHCEQSVREQEPGRRMQRVCTGALVHDEQTVRERLFRPGRRMQRVCIGTLVHLSKLSGNE